MKSQSAAGGRCRAATAVALESVQKPLFLTIMAGTPCEWDGDACSEQVVACRGIFYLVVSAGLVAGVVVDLGTICERTQ